MPMVKQFTAGLFFMLLAQASPPRFRLVVLEGLNGTMASAHAINDLGECAGEVTHSSGFATAAHWSARGRLTVLGRLDSSFGTTVLGINNAGVMVGGCGPLPHPFPLVWTVSSGGFPLAISNQVAAVAVNDAGDILSNDPSVYGVLIQRNGRQSPILGDLAGLSEDSRVAGTHHSGGAFRWSAAAGYEDLAMPAGFLDAAALGMSPDGTALGWLWNGTASLAAVWDLSGQPQVLPYSVESVYAVAIDSNPAGWVVGHQWGHGVMADPASERWYGTLWRGGIAYSLEDLIQDGPAAEITHCWAINSIGQIAAEGLVDGLPVALRLDPL